MNAVLLSSKNMCWCTPQDFFDKLNEEFNFVLDAAATNDTAKCRLYYTPEMDGLLQSWDVDYALQTRTVNRQKMLRRFRLWWLCITRK